jgi:hypothetical protein
MKTIPAWALAAATVVFLTYEWFAPSGSSALFDAIDKETLQRVLAFPLLVASAAVVLSPRYAPKDKYWAYATIGMLAGFWLET